MLGALQYFSAFIDQNVFYYVPFYMMYVLFTTLHVKFAYPTLRIGLRYRLLNKLLTDSMPFRKFTIFYMILYSKNVLSSNEIFSLSLMSCTLKTENIPIHLSSSKWISRYFFSLIFTIGFGCLRNSYSIFLLLS